MTNLDRAKTLLEDASEASESENDLMFWQPIYFNAYWLRSNSEVLVSDSLRGTACAMSFCCRTANDGLLCCIADSIRFMKSSLTFLAAVPSGRLERRKARSGNIIITIVSWQEDGQNYVCLIIDMYTMSIWNGVWAGARKYPGTVACCLQKNAESLALVVTFFPHDDHTVIFIYYRYCFLLSGMCTGICKKSTGRIIFHMELVKCTDSNIALACHQLEKCSK